MCYRAWIPFQLSSLVDSSLSGDSLLLFLAFSSQPAPRTAHQRAEVLLSLRTFSGGGLQLAVEGALETDPLIIFPSSWSLPTTHLGGVERKQSEQRGTPRTLSGGRATDPTVKGEYNPSPGLADSFHPWICPRRAQLSPWPSACLTILGNASASFIKHYREHQNIHNMFINIIFK